MGGDAGWIAGVEYIKNIALALGSLPKEARSTFELSVICSRELREDIQNQIRPCLDKLFYEEDYLQPETFLNRVRWKAMKVISGQTNPRLEKFLHSQSIDFVYPHLSRTHSGKPYRSAECIFDFQHKYLSHFFTPEEIKGRDSWFLTVANTADTVVLNSKSAESDFHKFFPKNAQKTKVLTFKTVPGTEWFNENPEAVQKIYHLPDKFFLISNQFWQHKNHLVVFEALKLLSKRSVYPTVVCTGHFYDRRCPNHSDTLMQFIHKAGISQQVHLLGLIPKLDQVQLMRRSIAVIQPSLFEGWSTLVEDARLLGKSILLSDLSVHKEQNPPDSLFFERDSSEKLAKLMEEWWETLASGPNVKRELAAVEVARQEVKDFGFRFLEIAKGSA